MADDKAAKASSEKKLSLSSGWQVLGASVRGASHIRSDMPNQDALGWWPSSADDPSQHPADTLLLAVADGHGGPEYTCSHIGARYAVKVARRLLVQEVLPQIVDGRAPLFKRTLSEWLPKFLVRRWLQSVQRHAARYPPGTTQAKKSTQYDLQAASQAKPDRAGAELSRSNAPKVDPRVRPYGTTLLAALLSSTFHLYLQLGDGDILTISEEGQVARPPFPADSRLLANETTSLCSPEAWRFVRIHFQPIIKKTPSLVLLATDGYTNSFVDDASFEQVARDLYATIQEDGPAAVARHLPDWLTATSAAGSGDDISVAIAYRDTEMNTIRRNNAYHQS